MKKIDVIIGVLICLTTLSVIFTGIFTTCNSNYDNDLLKKEIELTTKTVDSFRYRLAGLNYEMYYLMNACDNPSIKLIVNENQTGYFAVSNDEDTINQFYKIGALSCPEFLLTKRGYYQRIYLEIINDSLNLNYDIYKKNNEGTLCKPLSNIFIWVSIVLSIITIGIYFLASRMNRKLVI